MQVVNSAHLAPTIFFFFLFLQFLRLYINLGVMTDLERLLSTQSSLAYAPCLTLSALPRRW